jgi:hypothetical protein
MYRQLVVVTVVVAATMATGTRWAMAGGASPPRSRAAATGSVPDNPLLAAVPADTPYVFASFKPVPLYALRGLADLLGPHVRRGFLEGTAAGGAAGARTGRDVLAEITALDVRGLADLGLNLQARFVIYGVRGYPVLRFEMGDGARLLEWLERRQSGAPLAERAGYHYRIVGSPRGPVLFALGAKEAIVAVAPRDVLAGDLDLFLGAQLPAKSLTTAQLRALAQRDGFTGQGVGFVDVARAGAILGGATCRAALTELAQSVPRIAIGFDDITPRRFSVGVVIELPPAMIAELRGLSSSLAGYDRMFGGRPLVAAAAAVNAERARPLVGRAAGAVKELAGACGVQNVVDAMTAVVSVADRPLPPFMAGLRSGLVVVNEFKPGPRGPEVFSGFGAVQVDHTDGILKLTPQVDNLKADRKPHALPAGGLISGHIAASETTFALAAGPGSAAQVTGLIAARSTPAPLAVLRADFARLGSAVANPARDADADALRILKAMGIGTMQLVVDDRGLVVWNSLDLQ